MEILLCFFKILIFLEMGYAVRHGTNLLWSMSPLVNGKARIVGIEGDPNEWIPSGNVSVRHISAPHSAWQFRGLAFHYRFKTLYWSERSKQRIQGLMLVNRSTTTKTIFTGTSGSIDGLAVDWLSNNLYSVDPKYNWIKMFALKENSTEDPVYKVVVKTDLANPHGIAVYPQKGHLFWSDWGFFPKIEMSDLLGLNRRTVVSDNMLAPRGIAIDYKENVLYWVDSHKNTIESVQFNGNSRRIIVSQAGAKFFGVALFEKYLFVSEQLDGHLRIYDKNTGKGYINYQLGYIPYDVTMYDETLQPGNSSACDELKCDQICVNMPLSGPRCYCGDGFEIQEDQKTCVASRLFMRPAHIYAINDAICQYPANFGHMSLKNVTLSKQCFIKTRKGFMALAYDGDQRMLFYSENVTKSISKVQLKRGEYTTTIVKGIGVVKGLAFDWMTKNLYWTDSKYQWIMVARPDGRFQKQLITENLVDPLGIAVHPQRGELYWSDPGRKVIEVSALNGGGRRQLPVADISHPNHLFLDCTSDTLYWADSGLNQVVSYDLALGMASVVFKYQSASFYGISIFQDYLVWTDQFDMNGIHIADMQTKNKVRGILHPQTGIALDVIAYDVLNQPILDVACGDNNGYCDQLCLGLFNDSYVCACGTGFQLDEDLRSCISASVRENFVIAADSYQKQLYQMDLATGDVYVIAPEVSHSRPIAVGFDPVRGHLYWTDNDNSKGKAIQRVNIEGRSAEIVKALSKDSVVDGLAADYTNRLLFYTDTGLDRIQVISMDNYLICKTIIQDNLDEPRAITIHPLKGLLFWSDWGSEPKIELANMDGSKRRIFLNLSGEAWPNGLIIDYQENVLYWVDAKKNTIEAMSIEGRDRRLVVKESDAHYFGIALNGNNLIISDWKTNYLKTIPKTTLDGGSSNMKQLGPGAFSRLNGLASYNSTYLIKGANGCTSVFSCDHICIPLPNLKFVCACADGYKEMGYRCIQTDENATSIESQAKYHPGSRASSQYITYPDSGLSKGGIIAIAVVCVVAFIIIIISAMFVFTRWRSGRIRHERLKDTSDNQVDNFYRITFPDKQQESVSFDSGFDQYDQAQRS
ncbi:low-density lipoprotein receptor-related protein 4-like [Saccostrea echinata]|uniref:low-density lipoprotein receptor-related protein 4-like n=1 Tax=Saccostrea echinata TaxID=191078 RepID=UPI002A7FD289|nr:low-density lipoprotein receptor-related protein 4-like [Saccostrea echinata]